MSNARRTVIVCVDDEKYVLDSLTMQIRKIYGDTYLVETGTSGEEGLDILAELLREGYEVPLVISDYIMPGMRGDAFLTEVGRLDADIHKVMLTGHATMDGLANAVNNADLYRYLSKPWEETDLHLTINEAIKSWVQKREHRRLLGKYEMLYLEAQENYLRAQETFVAAIRSLANAIDARDPYTNGHSRRVTHYAMLIGRQMGLRQERLEHLEYMSILHDIGKIGISDAILHKETSLTMDEYDLMKQHVRIGASIIEDMEALRPLLDGILYHHERYDGAGYVGERRGTGIPLEARVITVADAFDAMTSDRPYRQKLSVPEAADEMRRCSGTQFDPDIVDVFLDILKDPVNLSL